MSSPDLHFPLPLADARVWTGRAYEWLVRAGCTCGWSTLANTDALGKVTLDEHCRVRSAAAELAKRA